MWFTSAVIVFGIVGFFSFLGDGVVVVINGVEYHVFVKWFAGRKGRR